MEYKCNIERDRNWLLFNKRENILADSILEITIDLSDVLKWKEYLAEYTCDKLGIDKRSTYNFDAFFDMLSDRESFWWEKEKTKKIFFYVINRKMGPEHFPSKEEMYWHQIYTMIFIDISVFKDIKTVFVY